MTNKELNRKVAKVLLGWEDFWGEPAYYLNDHILARQVVNRMGSCTVVQVGPDVFQASLNTTKGAFQAKAGNETMALLLVALEAKK